MKNGHVLDENFLMTIASLGAFAMQEFDESVAVMLLYQIGELFQSYAVNKSRNAISSLVELRPMPRVSARSRSDGILLPIINLPSFINWKM